MSREVKIGAGVAGSFLCLVGAVVGTKMYKGDVPKNLEGAVAAISELEKKIEEVKPSPTTTPPNPFNPGSEPVPLLPTGASTPAAPPAFPTPPGGLNLPALPPGGEIGFPNPTEIAAPITDAAKEVARNLELQRQREQEQLRLALEKKKLEAESFGNSLIDGARKNVDQVSKDLANKTNNAINSLPTLPDPAAITLPGAPPLTFADNTIAGGRKPVNPNDTPPPSSGPPSGPSAIPAVPKPADAPPPPATFGGLPSLPEAPKTIVGGGNPSPAPSTGSGLPSVPEPKTIVGGNTSPTTIKPKDTPSPFSDLPKPPSSGDPFAPAVPNAGAPPIPPSAGPTSVPTIPGPKPFTDSPPAPSTPSFPTNPMSVPTPPPFGSSAPPPVPGPPARTDVPPISDPFGGGVNGPPSNPPSNGGFTPLVPPAPAVRTDNAERYQCQGNENYALIAARKYGNDSLARALEEYNRDLPGAPENVRAAPPRLQPNTVVYVPSQNYLMERYSRFVSGGAAPPNAGLTGGNPNRPPLGNDIGISAPTPPTAKTTAPAADAGVTAFRVPTGGLYLSQIAERQLGSPLRWIDIYRLNPGLQPEQPLREGMEIKMPAK